MRRQGAESCILSISPSIKASKRNNCIKPVSNGQHSAGMIRTSRPESVNLGVVGGAKPLGPRFAPNLIFTGNPRCHDATVPSGDPSGRSVRESDLPLLSRCPCCERHSLNRNIGEFRRVSTIRLLRTGSSIVISEPLIGGYGILLKDFRSRFVESLHEPACRAARSRDLSNPLDRSRKTTECVN